MDFSTFQKELQEIKEWLKREFQTIRTGQATPSILDSVRVESYGTRVQLNQVASVSIEGSKSLLVTPYDKGQIKQIQNAISDADLGVSAVGTDSGIRVTFPDLTVGRRELLSKIAREKLEQARVTVRQEREKLWTEIQRQQKEGEISEDLKFTSKEKMEEIVKVINSELEDLTKKKEEEIKA